MLVNPTLSSLPKIYQKKTRKRNKKIKQNLQVELIMNARVPEIPAHIRKSACNPVHRPPEHRRQKAAATSPPVRLRVRRDFHALIIFSKREFRKFDGISARQCFYGLLDAGLVFRPRPDREAESLIRHTSLEPPCCFHPTSRSWDLGGDLDRRRCRRNS